MLLFQAPNVVLSHVSQCDKIVIVVIIVDGLVKYGGPAVLWFPLVQHCLCLLMTTSCTTWNSLRLSVNVCCVCVQ